MRIPPYYKRPGWQRFFAGLALGVIVGWIFFLSHYGQVYQDMVVKIGKQEGMIRHLEADIEQLKIDQIVLNEENLKKLTVQDIQVRITNEREMKLSQLTLFELKQQVLAELDFMERKDIESVDESLDLLYRTIQNKTYLVNETEYTVEIKGHSLYTTLRLHIEIHIKQKR
ncbi:sporulation membrane protein YtrI [Alkalihalobacillus trypoxylicola]|uniref:Sporulation membrane protein YtrI C-terminal domain-containing protein n=1 Tax=Alkalihalobacillus trypoxylicola TaxID=519424 RepID=A0A162EAY5_9BACI|nr:sporulation membrane protein YtrI [Alkalihalobacillus trypoxylicola]KYG32189.1 hypothetical protein AZF04_05330 [Alkalihalobacillus trypoxylicola]